MSAPAESATPDQTQLRELIPPDRKRVYDIRTVLRTLCDELLELRAGLGRDRDRAGADRRATAGGDRQ